MPVTREVGGCSEGMQNGMTPLHLATWTAVRTRDTSVVEALLEHNAEVAALDKVRSCAPSVKPVQVAGPSAQQPCLGMLKGQEV